MKVFYVLHTDLAGFLAAACKTEGWELAASPVACEWITEHPFNQNIRDRYSRMVDPDILENVEKIERVIRWLVIVKDKT